MRQQPDGGAEKLIEHAESHTVVAALAGLDCDDFPEFRIGLALGTPNGVNPRVELARHT